VLQYDTPLALLTQPADAFVARLLGADDALRRLSLMPVGAALSNEATTPPPAGPPLDPSDNLRHALTRLLAEGRSTLSVTGGGHISLATIRNLATNPAIT